MTNQDARETMNAAQVRNDEKAANVAAYAGLSLEELEAKADELADVMDSTKRGSEEWNKASAETRRIEDAIFAITG